MLIIYIHIRSLLDYHGVCLIIMQLEIREYYTMNRSNKKLFKFRNLLLIIYIHIQSLHACLSIQETVQSFDIHTLNKLHNFSI